MAEAPPGSRPTLDRKRRLVGLLSGAASGALGALSFPPASQVWLAWVALVPLLAHVRATRGEQVGSPFYLFGAVYFAIGLAWLNPVITVVGTLLLSLFLSFLFFWPLGHALGLLVRRGRPFLLAVTLSWVGFDWIRSWLFGGFPWLFLAHTQADLLPLVQVADLAGAYAVTGLVVLVNAAITEALGRLRAGRRAAALVPVGAAAALVAAALVYGAVRPGTIEERPGPRVLLVQANVPQYMKREALSRAVAELPSREGILLRHLRLTQVGLLRNPGAEVVIWPETMFTLPITDEPGPEGEDARLLARLGLAKVAQVAGGRPVILGAPYTTAEGEPRNSVFLIDERGGMLGRYDKRHLVPGGEFIPLRDLAPDALVRWVARIIEANAGFVPDLTVGTEVALFEAADTRFAPLVCFEIMFPALCRDAVREGADVLLNLTNYGWFPETGEPDQAQQMAVCRAVEYRRPVVVSANTGISAVISAKGTCRTLETGGRVKDVSGILAETVPLSESSSLYAWWGDAPAGAAAALVLAGVGIGLLGRFGRRRVTG